MSGTGAPATVHENREDVQHRVEVHVSGVVMDYDGNVLMLRRALWRDIAPGHWECGGGQVRPGEGWREAVQRHYRDELGLLVLPFSNAPCLTYEVPGDPGEGCKALGVRVLCLCPTPPGKIVLPDTYVEHAWVGDDVGVLHRTPTVYGLQGAIKWAWVERNRRRRKQ